MKLMASTKFMGEEQGEESKDQPWPRDLAILGTGDFGRALASYALRRGVDIVVGSREPDNRVSFFDNANVPVVPVEEAIQAAKMVVAAVPKVAYGQLPFNLLSPSQVLVDCSNRYHSRSHDGQSQAEQLQALASSACPGITVVKAFNVISSYALEGNLDHGKEIPLAGDKLSSKEEVAALARLFGFSPSDWGTLSSAAMAIEDLPHRLFPQWRLPIFISFVLYLLAYFLTFFRSLGCYYDEEGDRVWDFNEEGAADNWYKYTHKAANCHAVWLLALCYLPGCLAGYIQLARGTKYSKFPRWLASWMNMRKQLGLLMLPSATYHAFAYMLDYDPKSRHDIPYPTADMENATFNFEVETMLAGGAEERDFKELSYLAFGLGAYLLAVTLGLTSLPSVSASMTWREFRLLQSRMGWACLAATTAHVVFKGWRGVWDLQCCIPSETMLPLIPVAAAVFLKVPLLLLDGRLTRIRQGKVAKGCC